MVRNETELRQQLTDAAVAANVQDVAKCVDALIPNTTQVGTFSRDDLAEPDGTMTVVLNRGQRSIEGAVRAYALEESRGRNSTHVDRDAATRQHIAQRKADATRGGLGRRGTYA